MAGLRQRLWPRRRVEPGHDEKSARILTMKDELPTERHLMAFTHSSQIFTTTGYSPWNGVLGGIL
jgi:hypothetical protein